MQEALSASSAGHTKKLGVDVGEGFA